MIGYYRHVQACNSWDRAHFVPLYVPEGRVGWIKVDRLPLLERFSGIFEVDQHAVRFSEHLSSFDDRSAAIDMVSRALAVERKVPAYRNELFAASVHWDAEPCFAVDRGLVPFFGIKGYGVHLNGYFKGRDGLGVWIGRRSATKKVDPSKLDNVVAGGIGAGYSVWETLLKEGAEEAAMTPELLSSAVPVGRIQYRLELPEGMRDDVLFVYDLEVPDDFIPQNTDGEFESFAQMSLSACLDLIARTDSFKFNVNLTMIDFAIRHGAIAADHPEYTQLVAGLAGGLIRDT